MKQPTWRILNIISLICLVVATAAAALLGGCDNLLECTSGQVPMKCHWAFRAVAVLGIVGIISSVLGLTAKNKETRRATSIATLAICIAAILAPTDLVIGICANTEMQCHQTALIVWVALAISVIISLVQAAKADPVQADKPKMQL